MPRIDFGRFNRLALVLLLVAGGGCSSVTHYVSPRITGRVLDEETHQPVANVRVVRQPGSARSTAPSAPMPKGGQAIQAPPAERTAEDGTFTIASQSAMAFIIKPGWYSVQLKFDRLGYRTFTTNYTLGDSTNTAAGEPVVVAGDILLHQVGSDEGKPVIISR